MEFKPGLYEHYKGGIYIALHLVTHHETSEQFVVYVSLVHGKVRLREWNTPGKDSWVNLVGPDGKTTFDRVDGVPRFKYLEPA